MISTDILQYHLSVSWSLIIRKCPGVRYEQIKRSAARQYTKSKMPLEHSTAKGMSPLNPFPWWSGCTEGEEEERVKEPKGMDDTSKTGLEHIRIHRGYGSISRAYMYLFQMES